MNDQTAPAVTDDDRRQAYEWAKSVESNLDTWGGRLSAPARVILNAVPTPPLPTMADMPEEERPACQRMQCDTGPAGRRGVITRAEDWHVYVVDKETGKHSTYSPDLVIPRPDLPRLTWPGDTPAPAPAALPEGWRLADHPDHGRVIVTTETPDIGGYVYAVAFSPGRTTGFYWFSCKTDELTYLDQEADQ